MFANTFIHIIRIYSIPNIPINLRTYNRFDAKQIHVEAIISFRTNICFNFSDTGKYSLQNIQRSSKLHIQAKIRLQIIAYKRIYLLHTDSNSTTLPQASVSPHHFGPPPPPRQASVAPPIGVLGGWHIRLPWGEDPIQTSGQKLWYSICTYNMYNPFTRETIVYV